MEDSQVGEMGDSQVGERWGTVRKEKSSKNVSKVFRPSVILSHCLNFLFQFRLVCPQCSGQYSDLELHIKEGNNILKNCFLNS